MGIHGQSRFKRFINGKGFYVALAACLLAIGGVAVATFGETMFVSEAPSSEVPEPLKPVEQIVTNQPDDRKTTTATTTTTTLTTGSTTTATVPAALYILPFGNGVQKAYSDGHPTYSLTMGDWRTHDGVDFAGAIGDKVKALADGRVTALEQSPLWGTVITVDHGMEVFSTYCGVEAAVKKGDVVKVGSVIGTLAEIPCEAKDAPHLHLEMRIDGNIVDPVAAIGIEVRYLTEQTIK